jgi:hypothetical protein
MSDGKGGDTPDEDRATRPPDHAAGNDLKRGNEPIPRSTGDAIDVDAAHDRSS